MGNVLSLGYIQGIPCRGFDMFGLKRLQASQTESIPYGDLLLTLNIVICVAEGMGYWHCNCEGRPTLMDDRVGEDWIAIPPTPDDFSPKSFAR